jgi:hypothetical protein
MAQAAGAPAGVLHALDRIDPHARYHYLAELWAQSEVPPDDHAQSR